MHVLRRSLPASLIGILCAVAGCQRPGTPADPSAWEGAGFLRHVPAGTEGFLAVRRPDELAAVLTPVWSTLQATPATRENWLRSTPGRILEAFLEAPPAAPLHEALGELTGGGEVFVMLGPGTATQLAYLQQVKRLFEAARLRNLFTPLPPTDLEFETEPGAPDGPLTDDLPSAAFTEVMVPLPPAMEEALENFVREAAIPPLLLGAALPAGAKLPGVLENWVDSLPEQIPRDRITIDPHGTFTRARVPVTLLVPTEAAVRARDLLAAQIGDPYRATYMVRDLLAKTTVLTFGRLHGYFVVSIGTEQGLPALAPAVEDSLAAGAGFAGLAPLAARDPVALFYADPLIVSLAASPPPVDEYLDAALESALEFAPAGRIRPLQEAITSLRRQAAELFHQQVTAATGVLLREEDTWRAEMLGGSLAPRLAAVNAPPIAGADNSAPVVWTEHWQDDYLPRLLQFAEGVADLAADWLEALGPVFLEPDTAHRLNGLLRLVRTPGEFAGDDTAALVREAFDQRLAFVADFDGPALGPSFAADPAAAVNLPRVAVIAGLRDRAALTRLWESLRAAAPTLPPPIETPLSGDAVNYGYPLPLAGPDLGVHLAVDRTQWILGSSAALNAALAAAPAPPPGAPSVQSARALTTPLSLWAGVLAGALRADPAAAGLGAGSAPPDPATLEAAAVLLRTPRLLRYEAAWDHGTLRRVFESSPAP